MLLLLLIGAALWSQKHAQGCSQPDGDASSEYRENDHRNRCGPGLIQKKPKFHGATVFDREAEQRDEDRDAQQPDKKLEQSRHGKK